MDELHELLIDIAQDVHYALISESIDYWMVGGGSIGYLRDGELLPWDDDVDFVFLRKDIDRVQDALVKHLSEKYIIDKMNSSQNHKSYIRVVKPGTCLIRNVNAKYTKGICVELFPMIGVPASGIRRKVCITMAEAINTLNSLGDYVPRPVRRFVIASEKTMIMAFSKLGNEDNCPAWAPLNFFFSKQIVDKTFFGTPTKGVLCGRTIMFPEFLDRYLESVFGDWRTPPSEEDRAPRNIIIDTRAGWEEHIEEARRIQYGEKK